MKKLYSPEQNVQILISLLKQNDIKNIIASPGNTNTSFVASVQNDPFFNVYSCVDERSAAYMACGIASEISKPVVISCTGATASRNYIPGLTEAYYKKLPIIALTSTRPLFNVGNLHAQVIDRSRIQNDIAKLSIQLPIVKDKDDAYECELKINKALLELTKDGGGPVHINMQTNFLKPFEKIDLPKAKKINRISKKSEFPKINFSKIGILIASHKKFNKEELIAIEKFCESKNAVVFKDHTSNYYGKYAINLSLLAGQERLSIDQYKPDLLIHIGEITGDYYSLNLVSKEVWRISEDGELKDLFRRITNIFYMSEKYFFENYSEDTKDNTYFNFLKRKILDLHQKIPELPFSNLWVAQNSIDLIPKDSVIHFGILNSLRSWNFFETPETVCTDSNVGGFGIDGGMSSLVGASIANKDKMFFGVFGDLAFFYDMNVLGNRHVGSNIRILMVNNGKGTEFRQYNHDAAYFGESTDEFIAAAGHFGNKSKYVAKNFVEALGYKYLSASTKDQYIKNSIEFFKIEENNKPIVFEVFTDSDLESKALNLILNLEDDIQGRAKHMAKKVLGKKGIDLYRNIKGKK